MTDKTLVLIAAYNEAQIIQNTISDLKNSLPGIDILVIDDGSYDNTFDISVAQNVKTLKHPINLGQGAAIFTGFEYAKANEYDFVITVDADSQHHPEDIKNLISEAHKNEHDIIIGSRTKDMLNRYNSRYIINVFSNILTMLMTGKYISDSQSGLRSFNKKSYNLININSSEPPGRENCSEILVNALSLKLTTKEVPIRAIYTEYSLSKGQRLGNALGMAIKVIFGL